MKQVLGFGGVVLALDQLSKFIAQKYIFIFINQGFSFSFFANWSSFAALVLHTVGLGIVGVLVLRAKRLPAWWQGMLLGAATSNWLDRLIWGGVRDWLWLPGTSLHNNLADWVIFVLIIYSIIRLPRYD